MFATTENECEGDADSQREASEDEPASLPVTHEEGRLPDLLPRAEMVDDGTSRQRTNCGAEAIGHQHEQTLGRSLNLRRALTVDKDAAGDIEEVEGHAIHDA